MSALLLALVLLAQSTIESDLDAGRWKEASEKLEVLLKEQPTSVPVLFNLALSYSYLGDYPRSVDLYSKALEQDGNLYEARLNLARVYEKTENYGAAVVQIEKAVELRPDNVPARLQAGKIYREAGELEKAISMLKPLLPESRVELAQAYFAKKDYADAAAQFEQLARSEPGNENYFFLLGKTLFELERYEDARDALSGL